MQDFEQKYLDIISKNLKKHREEKGFSQEVLAEKVDCSREFINRLENRKEDPSLKMLLNLSEVLNINPEIFFEDEDEKFG